MILYHVDYRRNKRLGPRTTREKVERLDIYVFTESDVTYKGRCVGFDLSCCVNGEGVEVRTPEGRCDGTCDSLGVVKTPG